MSTGSTPAIAIAIRTETVGRSVAVNYIIIIIATFLIN